MRFYYYSPVRYDHDAVMDSWTLNRPWKEHNSFAIIFLLLPRKAKHYHTCQTDHCRWLQWWALCCFKYTITFSSHNDSERIWTGHPSSGGLISGAHFFSWRRLIAREMAAHEVAIIPFLKCLKNADGVPFLLTVYFLFTTKSLNGF